MKTNPIISVIVPVYKAEQYIHRCINSIISQSFIYWELLLIDDGSPDKSGTICDEYALRDNRVRVIHKENGGVSSARQVGLDSANGDYIIHVDPDDWVDSEMLSELYHVAVSDNSDIVFCDYYLSFEKKDIYVSQMPKSLNHFDLLNQLLGQELHGACWNKLIKRSLFQKHDIRFPIDVIRWEDLWVTCSLLMHNISISYVNKAFYHYDQCVNTESIVRKVSKKAVESQILFCERLEAMAATYNIAINESLYKCKAATKELMYASSLYSQDEVVNKFASINQQYILLNSRIKPLYLLPYSLVHLLRGNKRISKIIRMAYYNLVLPLIGMVKR